MIYLLARDMAVNGEVLPSTSLVYHWQSPGLLYVVGAVRRVKRSREPVETGNEFPVC